MKLAKTKENIKRLVDESGDEDILKEVRNILELASDNAYSLTAAQKKELDMLKEQHEAGRLKTYSWKEVRQKLINKLAK